MASIPQTQPPENQAVSEAAAMEESKEPLSGEGRRNRWADEADDFDAPDFDPFVVDSLENQQMWNKNEGNQFSEHNSIDHSICKIHVTDLDPKVTFQEVIRFFSPLAEALHVKFLRGNAKRYSNAAIVTFRDPSDAQKALSFSGQPGPVGGSQKNGKPDGVRPIQVTLFRETVNGDADAQFDGIRSVMSSNNSSKPNNRPSNNSSNNNSNNNRSTPGEQNGRKSRYSYSSTQGVDEAHNNHNTRPAQHGDSAKSHYNNNHNSNNNNSDGRQGSNRHKSPDFSELRKSTDKIPLATPIASPIMVEPPPIVAEVPPPVPEQPKSRPKLVLKPRSKPFEQEAASVSLNPAIFGSARPVEKSQNVPEHEHEEHSNNHCAAVLDHPPHIPNHVENHVQRPHHQFVPAPPSSSPSANHNEKHQEPLMNGDSTKRGILGVQPRGPPRDHVNDNSRAWRTTGYHNPKSMPEERRDPMHHHNNNHNHNHHNSNSNNHHHHNNNNNNHHHNNNSNNHHTSNNNNTHNQQNNSGNAPLYERDAAMKKPSDNRTHNVNTNSNENQLENDFHSKSEANSQRKVHVRNVMAVSSTKPPAVDVSTPAKDAIAIEDNSNNSNSSNNNCNNSNNNSNSNSNIANETSKRVEPDEPVILRKPEQKTGQTVWQARMEILENSLVSDKEKDSVTPSHFNQSADQMGSEKPKAPYLEKGNVQAAASTTGNNRKKKEYHQRNSTGSDRKPPNDTPVAGEESNRRGSRGGRGMRNREPGFKPRYSKDGAPADGRTADVRTPDGRSAQGRGRGGRRFSDRKPDNRPNTPTTITTPAGPPNPVNPSPGENPKVKTGNRYSAFCDSGEESN